ncbi:MAG TPA: L-aspartate oxidase [Chloroflexota bacterium]|nr:L-aspartate oxidase [Chloroflexota bacterium]
MGSIETEIGHGPIPGRVASRYDLVVVGSGIAGLYAALLAAPRCRVVLVTKGALEESNTRYAQGGIAVALAPDDSPELHQRDTLAAGDGMCDPEQVALLTREAPDCIMDLLSRGVPFDREGDALAGTLEAAHSRPRVLHAGGDATGMGIERTLAGALRGAGVTVLEETLCTGLLTAGDSVYGVELLGPSGRQSIVASAVLLATGGAGRLYARTTNPAVATGDGQAIAYLAGADLIDMEFVQFHPTALVLPGAPSFLISEAMRGEGGILRDRWGVAFMAAYHPDRELAPRDVVARAIHQQMEATGVGHVYLDMSHLPAERIERRFPTIVRFCRDHGIDPVKEPIPVAPAAHYIMGGVRTDGYGRTTLRGLVACGEVACTGVHGANRLASNSLLEGLVFARRAVAAILAGELDGTLDAEMFPIAGPSLPAGRPSLSSTARDELENIMWRHAGLIRSRESLLAARSALRALPIAEPAATREWYETGNLALLGELVVAAALQREECRGAHYRTDYPRSDPYLLRRIVLSCRGAGLVERSGVAPVPAGV